MKHFPEELLFMFMQIIPGKCSTSLRGSSHSILSEICICMFGLVENLGTVPVFHKCGTFIL